VIHGHERDLGAFFALLVVCVVEARLPVVFDVVLVVVIAGALGARDDGLVLARTARELRQLLELTFAEHRGRRQTDPGLNDARADVVAERRDQTRQLCQAGVGGGDVHVWQPDGDQDGEGTSGVGHPGWYSSSQKLWSPLTVLLATAKVASTESRRA
jgi:hypothetical protein